MSTIQTIRDEAAVAGDLDRVTLCDHAMGRIERTYRGKRITDRMVRVRGKSYTRAQARRAAMGAAS